jgi:hypothetical protein
MLLAGDIDSPFFNDPKIRAGVMMPANYSNIDLYRLAIIFFAFISESDQRILNVRLHTFMRRRGNCAQNVLEWLLTGQKDPTAELVGL